MQAIAAGGVLDAERLEPLADQAVVKKLQNLRGVGRWTAEYALLRGLGRANVFPGDDVGARNRLILDPKCLRTSGLRLTSHPVNDHSAAMAGRLTRREELYLGPYSPHLARVDRLHSIR